MAKNDVAPDMMMTLACHLSEKMRRHCVHVRAQATKKAVAALSGTGLYRPLAAETVSTKQ